MTAVTTGDGSHQGSTPPRGDGNHPGTPAPKLLPEEIRPLASDTFEAIRKSSVPESSARIPGNEHRPIRVDVNKGDNQFGLNWKSLQLVNSTAIPGSGRVVQKQPDMLMHPDVSAAFQELFKQ